MNMFKQFKSFNRCAQFKTFERNGSLSMNEISENGLNVLNGLNLLRS
jgi:hypothetical protein